MPTADATPGHLPPPPQLRGVDHTLALLADPYRFIGRHCDALGSDIFEARLLLRKTLFMRGARAAALFYDDTLFQRAGAAPEFLRATLFGNGGVQTLDGRAHRVRKALFLQVTAPGRVTELVDQVRAEWLRALPQWRGPPAFSLYRAVQPVLTRAVCTWAGVPLADADVPRRTRQLTALFDLAASGVLAHLRARVARWQAERWLAGLIRDARLDRQPLEEGRAAHAIAWHRDASGSLLPARVAAVELLNVLRPTVATSVYIAFAAHALQAHPAWRVRLHEQPLQAGRPCSDWSRDALAFVQEVRRHYPFFPAVAALVRTPFVCDGLAVPAGRRALLDLYGTNHDPRLWTNAQRFMPQRWLQRTPGRFDFVPQGGGDAAVHHRCPGEDVATRLTVLGLEILTRHMRYGSAPDNLAIDMARMPALPGGGFLLHGVQLVD